MTASIGILGTGLYLPEAVRDNSWWPQQITAKWPTTPPVDLSTLADDERRVAAAMERYRADPFKGARLRHVMDDKQTAIDMEVLAGREALANAGVSATK